MATCSTPTTNCNTTTSCETIPTVACGNNQYRVSLSRTGGQGAASTATSLGGYPFTITAPAENDILIFKSGAWVNVPKTISTVAALAPTGPSLGDIWLDTSVTPNVLRVWNGLSWALPTSGAVITVSATAPASKKIGDVWYDNGTTGRSYVWDGLQWVEMSPPGIGTPPVFLSGTPPTSPLVGQIWYDNITTGRSYVWDGAVWVDMNP